MSETPLIYKKLPAVMKSIRAVGKDRKNEAQGFKFRGIEDFYNVAHPAFVEHEVFVRTEVLEHISEDRETKTGSKQIRVLQKIAHHFYTTDGSSLPPVIIWGEGIDTADKATNKATSMAFKYAMAQTLCVPFADIEDGDRNSPEAGSGPRTFDKPKTPAVPDPGAPVLAPAPPADSRHIGPGQQNQFAIEFRYALPESLHKQAEELRHQWLADNGFIDKNGNPSSKMIPLAGWKATFAKACAWAQVQR